MDFFLEIHNGECGLGGHFCDHQRDHGPSVSSPGHRESVSTQNRESRSPKSEPGQGNEQGECTLLNNHGFPTEMCQKGIGANGNISLQLLVPEIWFTYQNLQNFTTKIARIFW